MRSTFVPTGALGYRIETFAKSTTGDAQTVHGTRIWFNQVKTAQLKRIDTKIVGYFIEMYLHGIAGLSCAVTTFRTAWRLVGKQPHTFEFIAGQFIGHG